MFHYAEYIIWIVLAFLWATQLLFLLLLYKTKTDKVLLPTTPATPAEPIEPAEPIRTAIPTESNIEEPIPDAADSPVVRDECVIEEKAPQKVRSYVMGELMFADYDDTPEPEQPALEVPPAPTNPVASVASEVPVDPVYPKENAPSSLTPQQAPMGVSIVLVSSNQDYLLRENLPLLLEQQYPCFEIILVDDNSSDDTADILQQLQARYPHLRTTFIPPSSRRISHRKLALTLGIKAARYPWLCFTDVDCRPQSPCWLSSLMRHVATDEDAQQTDAVIGFTGYDPESGLSAYLRRYDAFLQQLRLLGLATRGKAHTAYGTNLIYRRSIFFDHKGYSAHLNLERGEDDIFVNENIRPSHIMADVSASSIVRCTDTSQRHWKLDKLGRIATRRQLHGFMRHVLSLDTVSSLLYALLTLGVVVTAIVMHWWITLAIVVVLWAMRYVTQCLIFKRIGKALEEPNYGLFMPLLEVVRPVSEIIFRIRYILSPKSNYKRKQL